MREHLARWAVVVSAVLLVALAYTSAWSRSAAREAAREAPGAAQLAQDTVRQVPPEVLARGRTVFGEQNCAQCHAIAGAGNPRYPLDGVGARRTAAELRAWTVALEIMEDSLPPSVFRRKQAYQRLPAEDLDALIAYLGTLRTAR